jgi:hypothetical protein
MDIDLFEGDIVDHLGINYVVQYARGFMCVSGERRMLNISSLTTINVVATTYECREFKIPQVPNIIYRVSGGWVFPIDEVVCVKDKSLILTHNGGSMRDMSEIQQYAGMIYNGDKVYFGMEIEGGEVELRYGRCCINKEGQYFDLATKTFVE